MSSFDKVVKLACKPKAAPPKAKYLDPIIAATWSEDGAVHDVCKALSPRFREPNAIVVFKALIVLHTMIRNGATDNVLSYLSSSEVLRLSNVASANWEGYAAPENLQNYAVYLESRIRAYKDLKHDAVRVQAESNRDMRNSQSIEEEGYRIKKGVGKHSQSGAPTRSKTIMGRKLRVMTVEKGLLRETKAVHRMIDALVECRFYLDDLEDELTITALRMLVKDLLILFQAGNEGVINVLEHYFEMSHVDAEQALALYRHFCKQTELVVEFLGVAKKLQNLLNVPIPNLKHAPVSLAGALQEYLDDINFEQNRIEYKTNKEAAERSARKGSTTIKKTAERPPELKKGPPQAASSSSASGANNAAVVDFFATIEEEQPTMFNPQTNSPSSAYFQQQGAANPFMQMQMATGQPFAQQPQMQPQPTGYPMGAPAPNPFGLQAPPSHLRPQPTGQPGGHRPFTSFIPNNAQGMPQMVTGQNFLQPQMTGANPFRQSMVMPQTTGMAMFGVGGPGLQQQNTATPFMQNQNTGMGQAAFGGFGSQPNLNQLPMSQPMAQPSNMNGQQFSNALPSFASQPNMNGHSIQRPSSTPLTSMPSANSSSANSPPVAQPVKTHQTGTRNPFGRVATPPPPVPKQPTLMELAMGGGNMQMHGNGQQQQQAPQPTGGQNGFAYSNSSLNPGATDISSIASSFSFSKSTDKPAESPSSFSPSGLNSQNTSTSTATSSAFSDSLWSSSMSSQQTGATNASSAPSISFTPAIKPQQTGFSGLKAFKPSSSFGASLMESLPPIPGSAPATPSVGGTSDPMNGQPQSGAFSTSSPSTPAPGTQSSFQSSFTTGSGLRAQPTGFGALNSQATGMGNFSGMGATTGTGLRPQMTGAVANPFRASMVNGQTTGGMPMFGAGGQQQQQQQQQQPGMGMGNNMFMQSNNAFGSAFGNGGQPQQQQQQQNAQAASLI